MSKFPVDAPRQKVIKALGKLGFVIIREREHIAMLRENADGTKTPLTMPNHPVIKVLPCGLFAHKPVFRGKILSRPINK